MVNWKDYVETIMEVYVLSQDGLAKSLGTTQQSISNWKTRARTPSAPKQSLMLEKYPDVNREDFPLGGEEVVVFARAEAYKELPQDVRGFVRRMNMHKTQKVINIFTELDSFVSDIEKIEKKRKKLRKKVHAARG